MKRCLLLTMAIMSLWVSQVNADVAPSPRPIIIPPAPKDSPVPMIIAGVAVALAVVLLGLWIANRRRSGKSQNQQACRLPSEAEDI